MVVVDGDGEPDVFAVFASLLDPLEPDDESLPDEGTAPDDDESDPVEESPPDEVRALPGDEVAERSFLAQPEPLKCTAGAENPLRIVPSAPQLGQNLGPLS